MNSTLKNTISKIDSVLTGRSNDQMVTKKMQKSKSSLDSDIKEREKRNNEIFVQDFPTNLKPMLATLVDKPFNNKEWVFEVK
jgi:bifunctional non-homologous end joining protein LigD